jgi:hypothetical protein
MTETAATRYRKKNRDRINAYARDYREQNPEKFQNYRKRSDVNWKALSAERRENKPWAVKCDEVRFRAKRLGIAFDLTYEYLQSIWPQNGKCPILGIDLKNNSGRGTRDSSPSIDRIDCTKGYVQGNVQVISQRANRIKNNATLEELKLLVEHMSR